MEQMLMNIKYNEYNKENSDGLTPLFYALELGMDINKKVVNGSAHNLMYMKVKVEMKNIAKFLIKHGTNIKKKTVID
ncbi:hypothetical protein BCR32DRAFT_281790 [Anaeromyces robustus]|uniref:Ankyrin n=1 Tax=Anaeromyces robustus TaxID=1754192 RepID=A0A1Y1WZS8_9FUNG|nr:hypothetical protein BCR32DRAFT_281790 [Anaeromyces robustus]|eukprot:ORX78983.1 hypothetical protein BCR32DRAFT_281790 [Anaeromyces robustus]